MAYLDDYDENQQQDDFKYEKPEGLRSKDVYASSNRFLKYTDLQDWAKENAKPERRILVIKDWGLVEMVSNFEETKGQKRKQVIIQFDVPDEDPFHGKWLGLNKTNDERICRLTGTDFYEQWPGYAIQLLVSETTRVNGGPKVPCLRVNEGFILTPQEVRAEQQKQMRAQPQRQVSAPPPSVVQPPTSKPMTRVADSFDRAVPPDGEPETSGTLDEEFRNQF